ncbi:recombinase family protein [Streptomyces yaizuensis]|uniref:Recombinase family protein n=1 Tax=Streptomyces yaizuensis TaxID=2989713 RepID=A0ABQ5PB15_9ACTN|nr:recombinase family protein [Streptomyces sp. YSPA8]GLF99784.1 recombinase family protein [Streptomyces sp. YSPA8]
MIDTRDPDRPSKTFSRSYIAPPLQAHLDGGGSVESWLAGRTPIASMARISADLLDGEAIGVGRQHKNNTRNAAKHGCAVVVHYEDNNITAAKREVRRPAFIQMVRDITHGEEEETGIPVHGCIAVERERVWRMPRDFVAFQDALIMNGTGIYIEEQSRLDLVNDDGAIIAALATSGSSEAEVKKIRKRTTRNARDRAEEGKLYGGPRRFGWLGADKESGRPGNKYLDPKEFPHMVDQFLMRHEGKSWRSITAEMNRRRVLTARGNRWTEQAVKSLVTNPALWGGRVLDGKIIVDEETGDPITGSWETPEEITYEKWLVVMAGVEANRLHRGMSQPKRNPTEDDRRGRRYKYSGFLRCGRDNELDETCYSKMTGNKGSGKNKDHYRCGDANCKGISRQAEAVDTYLDGLTLAYLEKHFAGTVAIPIPWRGKEKLKALKVQRKSVKDSVADGTAEWGDVHDLLLRLNRNIKTLEEEEKEHVRKEADRNLLRGWSREKWESFDFEQRQRAIGQVLAAVIVMPIPQGVSDKAPFNPALLKPVWRKEAGQKSTQQSGDQADGTAPIAA